MKIIAIFLISVVMVYSQSREAEQKQFEWNLSGTTTTAYLSTIHPSNPQSVKDYFKSDNFILGWHWGGERLISKVMKVNQADILATQYQPQSYENNTNLFIRSFYDGQYLYTHCKEDNTYLHTKSLKYSAAITIDANDPYHLIKLNNDPENNIFGFGYKNPSCSTFISNDGLHRLLVDPANVPPNTEILSNPWPNYLLTYHATNNANVNENFTGRAYFLSINLRRLSNTVGDVPILKIEVPYKYLTKDANGNDILAVGTAKFTQLPTNTIGDIYMVTVN